MAIIKCPECSHEVSTLAPCCPNCGVEIANNLVYCPDCGKTLLKSTISCPNCHCVINSEPTYTHKKKKDRYREYEVKEYTVPKNYKTLWTILFTLLLIGVIAVGGYYWYNYKIQNEHMQKDYQLLKDNQNITAYETFLEKYPQSPYIEKVKEKMDTLKVIQKEWTDISTSTNMEDFSDFMQKYPYSDFNKICQNKIDSLAWIQAVMDNTPTAYLTYATSYPQSAYNAKSKIGMHPTEDMSNLSYQEKSDLAKTIKNYNQAISTNNRDSLSYLMTSNMQKEAIKTMENIHKNNKYVLYYLSSSIHPTKAPSLRYPFVYVVKYRVSEYLISNSNITTRSAYYASTILSPDKHIMAIRYKNAPVYKPIEEDTNTSTEEANSQQNDF